MAERTCVLVEYKAAIDFCQPSLPQYEETRGVLEDVHSMGLRIDIRQECWSKLTKSLGDSMKTFKALRDEASETLKRSEDDDAALEVYTDRVLQRDTLEENGVDIDSPHLPEIQELENGVTDMGLREFRQHSDEIVKDCRRGQERLDLLIDNRYKRGGEDVTFFEISVRNNISEDARVRLLLGAYIWSRSNPGYLLTRCNSDIHQKKAQIESNMGNERFSIVCPTEYSDQDV